MRCRHCRTDCGKPRVHSDTLGRWWVTWIHQGWADSTCLATWEVAIEHATLLWFNGHTHDCSCARCYNLAMVG